MPGGNDNTLKVVILWIISPVAHIRHLVKLPEADSIYVSADHDSMSFNGQYDWCPIQ